ncbi:hypothetical protein ACFSJX_10035 [Hymenobacter bucti]
MSGGGFGFELSGKSWLLALLISLGLLAGSVKGFIEAFSGHSTLIAVVLFILSTLGLVSGLILAVVVFMSSK